MISIIIIVKNDRGVDDTLHHLTKVIDKPTDTEIIVVDASEGKLGDIRKKYPGINWIQFAPIPGRKITIPHQRNVGVRAAKGDIIVFIDASCIPIKEWLSYVTAPIMNSNEYVVCGKTISTASNSIRDQLNLNQNKYLHECPTINLAINRSIFTKIGYFDENFEYGSDVDFSWRLTDHQYRIKYVTSAEVKHPWGNIHEDMTRSYFYGRARAQLYLKHKNRLKIILNRDPICVIYPLYILGTPIGIIFPYYYLLLLIPLIKNYKSKPITTMCDHLIYGVGVLSLLFSKALKLSL